MSLTLAASLVATAPAAAEETLVLYNWATYFPPDLLDKFEAETGIRVITEVFESNETMLANVETGVGNYDVIVPSDYMVRIMIDRGLLQPVHASGMENFRYVKPPFDDPWYDPGREYSVPNMQGTSGFMYDAAPGRRRPARRELAGILRPAAGADRQGRGPRRPARALSGRGLLHRRRSLHRGPCRGAAHPRRAHRGRSRSSPTTRQRHEPQSGESPAGRHR